MKLGLKGKNALITGSSRGIGFEIAKRLHEEGCRVVLNGQNSAALKNATNRLEGAIGLIADVRVPEAASSLIENTLKHTEKLDILVCNVGSGKSVKPGLETPEEWQRVFALNLWSATNCVEAASEALVASKGTIVCISSICGLETICDAPVTYSAAKAALHAFVRGVSRPLGAKGVRVNALAPGNILFDGSVWAEKVKESPALVEQMLQREVAMKRLGTPGEVADMVAFLSSRRSSFATGSVFRLDGGQLKS